MPLNSNELPKSGSPKQEPMDIGTYPARSVYMIDLGLQDGGEWQEKKKPPVNKIAIGYEFVDEFIKDEDGEAMEGKPRWLTEILPFYSLDADKANSTKRYMALDPKVVHKGAFGKLVDVPCNVTVTHSPNKKTGGVWENISGVSTMRDKDAKKCPALVGEPFVFDFDEPDLEVFERIPPFIQKIIKEGLKFNGSKLYELLGGDAGDAKVEGGEPEAGGEDSPY